MSEAGAQGAHDNQHEQPGLDAQAQQFLVDGQRSSVKAAVQVMATSRLQTAVVGLAGVRSQMQPQMVLV